jgi:hypothetical protein
LPERPFGCFAQMTPDPFSASPFSAGRTRIQYLGDIRMVHHGQRLSLGFEPSNHLACVHSRLDDLQRHLAANRNLLLGYVDQSHPAFPEHFAQGVGSDLAAKWLLKKIVELRSDRWRASVKERARLLVRFQEHLDLVTEFRRIQAARVQERLSLGTVRPFQAVEKQIADDDGIDGHGITRGTVRTAKQGASRSRANSHF